MLNDRESFAELPTAESTLLWAMRVWVVGHCRQQDLSARIGAGLTEFGAGEALGFLEGFMWALSRGATRPIEILCLCRPEVSADERLLLDAVAMLQRDDPCDAHGLLCHFLSDPAATVAIRSAESVARVLEEAGLVLPWSPATFGRRHASTQQRVVH